MHRYRAQNATARAQWHSSDLWSPGELAKLGPSPRNYPTEPLIYIRTRSEQELAGYRTALDYLFGQEWQPLNVGPILHLHRNLFEQTKVGGGRFKDSENVVVDRSPDGSVKVRFVPVSAASTEYFTVELINRYKDALAQGRHHPVLLVGCSCWTS